MYHGPVVATGDYKLNLKHWLTFGPILLVTMVVTIGAEPQSKTPAPMLFQSDGRAVQRVKVAIAKGDTSFMAAIDSLRQSADREMKSELCSVVTHVKPRPAPSGDKHDYVSMAPYWWPDPNKPDGLPYVNKDGQTNPEREKFDGPLLNKMSRAVSTLSLAYYLTGEEKYGQQAARQLRVWFLDADTKMNPHLQYAQFVPGRHNGSPTGIIDSRIFLHVTDAVGLLHSSPVWTANDHAGMQQWFRDFGSWLQTSKHGLKEAGQANNHGTWYDVQVATFSLFVGDQATAKKVLEDSKSKRIARHIEPDGRQPMELRRTKSWDYSDFNLEAFFALATLGDQVGVDLWNYQTTDGRSIRKALDWLVPYATGEQKWEQKQITPLRHNLIAPLLRRAAIAYKDDRYEQLLKKLPDNNGFHSSTTTLLHPKF